MCVVTKRRARARDRCVCSRAHFLWISKRGTQKIHAHFLTSNITCATRRSHTRQHNTLAYNESGYNPCVPAHHLMLLTLAVRVCAREHIWPPLRPIIGLDPFLDSIRVRTLYGAYVLPARVCVCACRCVCVCVCAQALTKLAAWRRSALGRDRVILSFSGSSYKYVHRGGAFCVSFSIRTDQIRRRRRHHHHHA